MITIFANIRINDNEGFQHLKDSFYSFDTISDNWLINVRGKFRHETIAFLQKELQERMILFELLDDSKGWIANALEMVSYAKHDYLLVWNEDHINIAPQGILAQVISEVNEKKADYLLYSWWLFGKARREFDCLPLEQGKHIDTILLTKDRWHQVREEGYPYYLLSLCGIYRREFFVNLLIKDRVKLPMFLTKNFYRCTALLNRLGLDLHQKKYFHIINGLLFHKLRRFPKETPFDLEKSPDRTDMLPFTIALSKQELFACIDDDLDTAGYQLIKRGAYPVEQCLCPAIPDSTKGESVLETNMAYRVTAVTIPATKVYRCKYYEDVVRTQSLLRETVIIMSGKVNIITKDTEYSLSAPCTVSVYPNLGYTITAIEEARVSIVSSNLESRDIYYEGKQGLIQK